MKLNSTGALDEEHTQIAIATLGDAAKYRAITCRHLLPGRATRQRVGVSEVVLVALSKRLGIGRRNLFDIVTKRKQLASPVVRRHTSFDPDQAWLNVDKSRSNPVPRDFLAQNDGAPLIQADHVKRVLAGIDPNRADN
jgi:hypothetical protein